MLGVVQLESDGLELHPGALAIPQVAERRPPANAPCVRAPGILGPETAVIDQAFYRGRPRSRRLASFAGQLEDLLMAEAKKIGLVVDLVDDLDIRQSPCVAAHGLSHDAFILRQHLVEGP